MYKIIGYTTNSGVIKANNRPWKNYTIHCAFTPEVNAKNLVGCSTKDIKVPERVFNKFQDEISTDNIIGCKVAFDFEINYYNGQEKLVCTDIIPLE